MQVQIKNYIHNLPDYKIPLFIHGVGNTLASMLDKIKQYEKNRYLLFLKRFSVSPSLIYYYCKNERALSSRVLTEILKSYENLTNEDVSKIFDTIFQNFTGISPRGNKPVFLPKFFSEELAYLTGVIIGDGHVSKKLEIRIVEETKEHTDYLTGIVYKIFGYRPVIVSTGSYYIIIISSAPIHFFFTKVIGLPEGKKKYKEFVPTFIRLNLDLTVNFLRGLFDSDGGVTLSRNGTKRSVLLSSVNASFLHELKLLIDGFGINLHLYSSGNKRGFELRTFNKMEIKKFNQRIGFIHPIKKERANALVAQSVEQSPRIVTGKR